MERPKPRVQQPLSMLRARQVMEQIDWRSPHWSNQGRPHLDQQLICCYFRRTREELSEFLHRRLEFLRCLKVS